MALPTRLESEKENGSWGCVPIRRPGLWLRGGEGSREEKEEQVKPPEQVPVLTRSGMSGAVI